jgi:hypothetical protein
MVRAYSLIILLSLGQTLLAQNIYHSPYSVYGIGILQPKTSSLNRSMGGAGLAVQDPLNLNHTNPASYSSIKFPVTHLYEMGFYTESNRLLTSTITESKTNGSLTNLNYWFRFSPKWAATVGLSPFSTTSYNITTNKLTGANQSASYRYRGDGTISQLSFGNGFMITKNLSLGVNGSLLFGSIKKTETMLQSDAASELIFENKVIVRKFKGDFGLQYRINVFNKGLVIGAVFDNGLLINARQKHLFTTSNSDTLSSKNGESLTYRLPRTVGTGLALHGKYSILSFDMTFQQWSQGSFEQQDIIMNDSWRIAMGYSYSGRPEDDSYLKNIGFRMGWYYQPYYLQLSGQTKPNYGLSTGISLPMKDYRSSINLTYSYDLLGTKTEGLILQKSQKIMFEVIIRDLWGVKRKFD